MTDYSKRKALKTAGALGIALGTVSLHPAVFASATSATLTDSAAIGGGLEVMAVHGAGHDMQISLINNSKLPIVIRDISPSIISTPAGDVDFGTLLSNGSQTLESGDAIELPMRVVANKHVVSAQFLPVVQRAISNKLSLTPSTNGYVLVNMA